LVGPQIAPSLLLLVGIGLSQTVMTLVTPLSTFLNGLNLLGRQAAFAGLTRWPVTISYFDHAVAEKSGEQTPVYAITFELFENGISRALVLDYNDEGFGFCAHRQWITGQH